jgi:6-phospho-beta-glucosidase
VGGFAQRMVAAKGAPFQVHLSLDQREAVAGSSYLCTQLRVGQMPARRDDEYLGQRHGLIGQETTGVGGMAKALRTIPVVSTSPTTCDRPRSALLVNFTNPSGLVTEGRSSATRPTAVPSAFVTRRIPPDDAPARVLEKELGQPSTPSE